LGPGWMAAAGRTAAVWTTSVCFTLSGPTAPGMPIVTSRTEPARACCRDSPPDDMQNLALGWRDSLAGEPLPAGGRAATGWRESRYRLAGEPLPAGGRAATGWRESRYRLAGEPLPVLLFVLGGRGRVGRGRWQSPWSYGSASYHDLPRGARRPGTHHGRTAIFHRGHSAPTISGPLHCGPCDCSSFRALWSQFKIGYSCVEPGCGACRRPSIAMRRLGWAWRALLTWPQRC
jgi:hypothetical protein